MFRTFQVKKLVLCSVVALGIVGLANADSIKCDSKEAIIAFATRTCKLSPYEINTLRKNGVSDIVYSEGYGIESRNHHTVLDGKTLTCAIQSVESDRPNTLNISITYIFTDFKNIKTDTNTAKCHAKIEMLVEDGNYKSDVNFTLQNGLIADNLESDFLGK